MESSPEVKYVLARLAHKLLVTSAIHHHASRREPKQESAFVPMVRFVEQYLPFQVSQRLGLLVGESATFYHETIARKYEHLYYKVKGLRPPVQRSVLEPLAAEKSRLGADLSDPRLVTTDSDFVEVKATPPIAQSVRC